MDTTGWVNADGKATRRIWKTVDGTYVPEGDQRAAFLAYGEGDEVSPVDLAPLRTPTAPVVPPVDVRTPSKTTRAR